MSDLRPFWSADSLRGLFDTPDWGVFSDALEAAHALPHAYIGGDMADVWSATNDPVFFLHHAFADMLYSRRQRIWGVRDFNGTHDFFDGQKIVSRQFLFRAFDVTVDWALEVDCVEYAPLRGKGTGGRGGGGRVTAGGDVCEEIESGHGGLSEQRCKRGEDILTK